MSKMRSAVLIVALVAILGAAFCFQAVAARAASIAAPVSIGQGSAAAIAFAASRSVFVSEEQLWREFNHAVDRHNARIAAQLLRILNMRHEHRVGLPR